MYKDNIEYARQRLLGTVVRHNNEPFIVSKIGITGVVLGAYLTNALEPVQVDLDDLNLEPVPLGYVNYNNSSYYVVRKPMRRDWRQGLRMANIAFIGPAGFHDLPHKSIRKTILGEYPKIEAAVAKLRGGVDKIAFSRHFALTSNLDLEYKGNCLVGKYDKVFTLEEPFKYLTEHLMETIYA
jgi:hypothetical protein